MFVFVPDLYFLKPVFWSCMYGCTCARIFIQSAWSNLCHVKIRCLSLFLTYISWFCVITILLPGSSVSLRMFLVMHHSVCWLQFSLVFPSLILSCVISWLPTISSNVLYVLVTLQLPGAHSVISDGILLFGCISMGGHIIPEAQNEHGCYGHFCKMSINFIYIFVRFAC